MMVYLVYRVRRAFQARKASPGRQVQLGLKVLLVSKVIEVILALHPHPDRKETLVYQVRVLKIVENPLSFIIAASFFLFQDNLDGPECPAPQAWMANLEFKALKETREQLVVMVNPALPDQSAPKVIVDLTVARVYL